MSSAVYPAGTDTTAAGACSWTTSHCFAADDLHTSQPNTYGGSFDDGPVPASEALYSFLKEKDLSLTQFVIGSNMLDNSASFAKAVDANQHFGIHTWSHKFLTTLTNEQIVGELGWGMQIIMDMTGGKVPNMYRPPDGDVDNRVRAIAQQCFGLKTVLWDYDTNDWHFTTMNNTATFNLTFLDTSLSAALNKSQSTGIIPLHHDLSQIASLLLIYLILISM